MSRDAEMLASHADETVPEKSNVKAPPTSLIGSPLSPITHIDPMTPSSKSSSISGAVQVLGKIVVSPPSASSVWPSGSNPIRPQPTTNAIHPYRTTHLCMAFSPHERP